MAKLQSQFIGIKAALDNTDGLSVAIKRRITRKAISAVTKLVLKAAKPEAKQHKLTGALAKSLGRKSKTNRNTGFSFGVVGPRRGVWGARVYPHGTRPQKPSRYAHLQELGSDHQQAFPFLEPAAQTTQEASTAAFEQTFTQEIDKEIAKRSHT
jgi:HK97 gp10 family phage protein